MSGQVPLGGAIPDATLASVVDRLVEKELASLAADAKNLRELVTPGEVLLATVRPSNGLTDILEILGNRVAAALPPDLLPGDTIAVRVTGFDGERIVLQNLGPAVEDSGAGQAEPAAPPAAPPTPGNVSYVSDALAAPDGPEAGGAPPQSPSSGAVTVAPGALPLPQRPRTPEDAREPSRGLTASNIVPLPRDGSGERRSGGGGPGSDGAGSSGGGGGRGSTPPGTTPRTGGPPPTQEELRARFPFDIRLSRVVIGTRGVLPAVPVPPAPEESKKLAILSSEFGDLPDRAPRRDDGLDRVAIDAALFAKRPPTVPPGAEVVEAQQQELFADVTLAVPDEDVLADTLRSAPVPPPVRGDVTIPRPLHGDGIPLPALPDRDGIAAPPSVPRSVVPAAPGRPQLPTASAIPAFIEPRSGGPRAANAEAKPLPPVPHIPEPGSVEARIAAARAAGSRANAPAPPPILPYGPRPPAAVEPGIPLVYEALPEPEEPAPAILAAEDTERVATEPAGDVTGRRTFVPPPDLRPFAPRTPVPQAAIVPTIPQRLPTVPPVIPPRAVPIGAPAASTDVSPAVVPLAASAEAEPDVRAIPREPVALLKALHLPISAGSVAAAKLALERPQAVSAALAALERALPAGDERTATLRTIVAFVARLDPAAPTFASQLAAYVEHVASGPEPLVRDVAAADTIANDDSAPGELVTVALAHAAERAVSAEGHLKSQLAQLLTLARTDATLAPILGHVQEALAAVTAQQVGMLPPGTSVSPNAVEFVIPLPATGGEHLARIRIERDAARRGTSIDGEDFRIAFILDTAHLGTIAVDLAAVGRTVDVGVKTEASRAAERVRAALPGLADRLERLRYTVASTHADVARPGGLPASALPSAPPRDPDALVDRDA